MRDVQSATMNDVMKSGGNTDDGQLWDEHEREGDKVDEEEHRVVGRVVCRDEEAKSHDKNEAVRLG